ncbi:MAG: hypothetical protein J0I47_07815 [Sphingomonas sp.]|uniref:hypothetical protein n=1 Tax=Sphingomonas sp. TaxID=28214 RepID=UPI001ACC5ED4|nr:hypothetical protein [Sphingomonas sp.]MBN8808128.1 hypothetical protein [Sphingomonas sp.]
MSSIDDAVARAQDMLDRTSPRYRTGPGRRARENDIAKRLTRVAVADAAIVAAVIVFGLLVMPIGMTGFLLVVLALIAVTVLLLATPAVAPPTLEKLHAVELKALPAQTGRWLDAQRPMLPAPAITLVDQIGLKLDALSPQLATLGEDAPAAAEIRKLVGEQLPAFVKGYEAVPAALRTVERNGKTPDQQLVDGLGVIGREIDDMAAQLAQGDLDALSTRGRYLEIKYQSG